MARRVWQPIAFQAQASDARWRTMKHTSARDMGLLIRAPGLADCGAEQRLLAVALDVGHLDVGAR